MDLNVVWDRVADPFGNPNAGAKPNQDDKAAANKDVDQKNKS